MSKINDYEKLNIVSDVCLVAAAKDRLETIHRIFEHLHSKSIRTDFYIVGAKENERLNFEGIEYSDYLMDRLECLKREISSKCILEVLKGDAFSNTLRFWEAIIYNKRFITNWKGVINSPYYDPRFVLLFTTPDDITPEFINSTEKVDYGYNGELSPYKLLDLIDANLSQK